MIGSKYLRELFHYPDQNTSINQLLELLKVKDPGFIESLSEPIDLSLCTEEEIKFLTITAALIDYYLQKHGLEVPVWLRSDTLSFDRPFYYPKRISDFDKVKLQCTNPYPFRARNVYFDLAGIERV